MTVHAPLSLDFRMTPPESPVTPTGSDSGVADWTERPPSTEMGCLERIATVFMDAIACLLSAVFSVIRSCWQMIHLVAPDSAAMTRPRREALPMRGQEPVPPCIDRIQPSNAAQGAASAALRTQITAMRTQMDQNGIGMEWTEDALEFALLHLDNAAEGDGAPLTAMATLLRRIGEAPSTRANTRVVLYSLSQILDSCLANGEFLQATVLSATQMQTNCSDRVETFFRQMRLCWELQCNPEMREPANLARLLIGIERVHLIEQIVRRNYPGEEELEANLYCLVQLKRELALPESTPNEMDHPGCAGRVQNALQRIKDEVLNRTRQIPDLCRILCANPEWETVMWSQQVTPLLVTVVEDLSALLPTGSDEEDAPFTWLNVLRTLASCLSIEDVQGVLEQIVQGDPINQDASRHRQQEAQRQRDARVALRYVASQQVAHWTPAVEAPLEAAELEVCRHLLSTLIVLGDRFNGDLPEEINGGSVLKILKLLKQIKHYAVRNATVVCLQEGGN